MSVTSSTERVTVRVSGLNEPIHGKPGITPLEILESTSGHPDGVLAARFNGTVVDLKRPLTEDGALEWITAEDPAKKSIFIVRPT